MLFVAEFVLVWRTINLLLPTHRASNGSSSAALPRSHKHTRPTSAMIDAELFERKSVMRGWAHRRTIHLFASEHWPTVHAALRQPEDGVSQREGQIAKLLVRVMRCCFCVVYVWLSGAVSFALPVLCVVVHLFVCL